MFFDNLFNFFQVMGVFIIVFLPAVVIHEFGHLIMMKLAGVKVLEFGIGVPFSKRWFYFRKFGIVWAFYPWLLGGFARSYGDNDAIDMAFEENKKDPELAKENYIQSRFEEMLMSRDLEFVLQDWALEFDNSWKDFEKNYSKNPVSYESQENQIKELIAGEYSKEIVSNEVFFNKNWLQQTAILLGGVTFNIITAIICFAIIFGFFGNNSLRKNITDIQVYEGSGTSVQKSNYAYLSVVKNGLLAQSGITGEDKVTTIGSQKMSELQSFSQLRDVIKSKAGQDLEVKYLDNNNIEQTKNIFLEKKDGCVALLGIGSGIFYDTNKVDINPILAGVAQTWIGTIDGFKQIGEILKSTLPTECDKRALNNLSGPAGVSKIGEQILKQGNPIEGYLTLVAAISLSLAIFNILPIPALDGGRWVIVTLNKLTGRRNRRLEATIIGVAFMAVMGLGFLILGLDILKIINGEFDLR
jgi:regulator of sigma E protease